MSLRNGSSDKQLGGSILSAPSESIVMNDDSSLFHSALSFAAVQPPQQPPATTAEGRTGDFEDDDHGDEITPLRGAHSEDQVEVTTDDESVHTDVIYLPELANRNHGSSSSRRSSSVVRNCLNVVSCGGLGVLQRLLGFR